MKRSPSIIHLDLDDALHLDVVQATSNIFAVIFGIPMESNKFVVRKIAQTVEPVKFVPKKVKIEVDEKAEKKEAPI